MKNGILGMMIAAGTVLAGVEMADAADPSGTVTVSPTTFSAVGQEITVTYRITNGDTRQIYTNSIFSHNETGAANCNFAPPLGPDSVLMEPFQTVECTATHITDDLDIARGAFVEWADFTMGVDPYDFESVTSATYVPDENPASVGCHMPEGQSSRFVFRYRGTGVLPC